MNDRLSSIFDAIPPCKIFADIACDHGYIAYAMLNSGKCERAYISDISAKSLVKAEKLLSAFIAEKRAESFVSDGFDNLPKADTALIAGVGGALITDILDRAKKAGKLPENLILQPMKHCDRVRRFAVGLSYKIEKDFTVSADGQFYDIIVLKKGKDSLTPEEAEFGRTNIRELPIDFKEKIRVQIGKLMSYAARDNIADDTRAEMLKKAKDLEKYV